LTNIIFLFIVQFCSLNPFPISIILKSKTFNHSQTTTVNYPILVETEKPKNTKKKKTQTQKFEDAAQHPDLDPQHENHGWL
jgi:hypothetical protein